jgi:hypothetical protein
MKSNDLDEGGDATSAEIDRPGDETRPDSVALERERSRIPSLYDPLSDSAWSGSAWSRRTVGGFLVGSGLCFVGALVVPAARQVLLAFAGIGLFTAVLTYGLSEGSFIESRDGERVYGSCADNLAAIVAALDLDDERVYVPCSDAGDSSVRLLVPGNVDRCFREPADGSVVDPSGRGLLLEPTGAGLYDEFREALTEPLASTPEPLAEQLTDALLRRFEFVAAADPVVHVGERRVTVAVSEGAFGPIGRFDHPVASFLAVGFAAGLEREIVLEVSAGADPGAWLVSCRWDTEDTRR